ncbi:MAG: hypothetical protein IJM18_06255, partial [Clostridia bacterium]|nr:hypothetical protein [Clostridia bacterium]
MKRAKRIAALLIAALMAVSLLPGSVFARAGAPLREAETVVAWNFNSETNAASEANANNNGALVTRDSSGSALSYAAGNGTANGKALNSSGWDSATADAPKYYTATVNTTGVSGITVSAEFRASNTGPKNIALYYSVDGANFIAAENASVALEGTAWGSITGTLPELCDNAETLELRFAVCDTVSANGGTIAGGGTLRIDNLTVIAESASVEPTESAEPSETSVPTDPPFVAVPIAEALDVPIGTSVCVCGIVTFIEGKNVYIQDDSAAIDLYLNANASGVAVGDSVMAVGTRAVYKGLPELSGIDQTDEQQFRVLSSGNELPCEEVTIAELLGNTDAYLCERVVIKSATLGAVNTAGNTPITQGESSINIYKIPAIEQVEGDIVDVTAIVSMFNTIQLRVAAASDVVTVPADDHITIAEALAADINTEGLCVIGTVTFIDGRNVYVQDSTGGIDLFLNAAASGVSLGDSVKAVGKRAAYKGLPELSGIDQTDEEQFKILSSGNALPCEEVTIAELLENTDAYLCERVVIKSATLGAVNTAGNTPITQGESSINIYKIPAVTQVEGDVVNVIAVVGMFNTVQLRVAAAADVTSVVPLEDPIDPADYPDYTTIAEVLAMTTAGGTVTVVGQVTMKFGNFGDLNSVALGDVEDNEIIGLQIYDFTNIASYNVGDIVAVTGTVGDYGGVRQLSSVTAVAVLNTETAPMQAQEVTIAELNANIGNYLSEFVVIKNAALGEYATSGSTIITDEAGNTMPIYRAAAYPDGILAGDVVSVYAVASKYNTTVQLRNGAPSDYVAENASYISVAEARALEIGASATVRAVVTFVDGRNVYVQDATAGIVLYLNAASDTVAVGDLVEATGTRAEYKGLPELSGIDASNEAQLKVISSGNALPLEKVTIEQILAAPDDYMCERVKIEAATLGAVNTAGNTPLTQGESSINIYKIPAVDFAEGDVVDVTAIVSCYNSAQLRVADASCITEAVVYNDPISSDLFTDGIMTIPEVIAAADSTEVVLIAQLVYRFGNYDSVNSAILEDIIDGEIYGLQMYNSLDDYQIGDVLKITATKTTYGGVPQIQSATAVEKLYSTDRIPAQVFDTFADLLANKEDLLSEYVMVRNVTLGAYNDNGSTIVTDSTGATMPIYRAASYTAYCVEEGEVVDLAAALSKYSATWQFRGGEYFGENKAPTITLGSFLDAEVGVDYDVAITVIDDYGIDNVMLTYVIGETTDEVEMVYNATNAKYRATVPGSAITSGSPTMTLTFTATDTSGLVGTATADVNIVDDPQIVEVSPRANSATYDDKTPVISVTFANAGEAPT